MRLCHIQLLLAAGTVLGGCSVIFESTPDNDADNADNATDGGDAIDASNSNPDADVGLSRSYCTPITCDDAPFVLNHFEMSQTSCPQGAVAEINSSLCQFDSSCAEFAQQFSTITHTMTLALYSGHLTFSAWVRPNTGSISLAPITLTNGLNCAIRIEIQGAGVNGAVNGLRSANAVLLDGCWNHVSFVVPIASEALASLQVNGGEPRSTPEKVSCAPTSDTWQLSFGTAYSGRIDDIVILPRAEQFDASGSCPTVCQ